MSATADDVIAATTATQTPVPDGNEPEPKRSADSATAVSNTDEEATEVLTPVQKRIDELTRRRYDAERDRDYWREQAQRAPRPEPTPPVPEPQAIGKTLADFAYDESKYQDHLFKQAETRAVAAAEKVLSQKQTQEARFQSITAHKEREAEFAKKVPDYFEVAHYAPITDSMAEIVMESEMSAELAYHLGKNRQVALNLSRLTPLQQAREMGRIEAKLAAKPTPAQVSTAPPPAPKLSASAAPSQKDPREMTDAEYGKWRAKQIAQRRGFERV